MDPRDLGLNLPVGFELEENDHSLIIKNPNGEIIFFSAIGAEKKQIEKDAWASVDRAFEVNIDELEE